MNDSILRIYLVGLWLSILGVAAALTTYTFIMGQEWFMMGTMLLLGPLIMGGMARDLLRKKDN